MYQNAGNGLKMVFASQIIILIGKILPGILGSVICAAAMVIMILGLKQAAMDDEGYNKAFILIIANLIIGFFSHGNGIFSSILSAVSSILLLCILYHICNATERLLNSIGKTSLANLGGAVWYVNLLCTIIYVSISFVARIPILNILAGIVGLLTWLVSLVGAILYLVFLSKSGNALS